MCSQHRPNIVDESTSDAIFEIAKLRAEDIDEIIKILVLADVGYFLYGTGLNEADIRLRLQRKFDEAAVNLLTVVARKYSSIVVGAAWIAHRQLSFFVSPKFFNMGCGRMIVRTVCEMAYAELGLDQIDAFVIRENIRSINLLEHSGFVFCGLNYSDIGIDHNRPVLHYRKLRPSLMG